MNKQGIMTLKGIFVRCFKRLLGIKMKIDCKHKNKVYSSIGVSLTVNPPINISYWICRDCGFEGEDRSQALELDRDYRDTKKRFGKTARGF